jgi:hypothetical protein
LSRASMSKFLNALMKFLAAFISWLSKYVEFPEWS